jgi:hypothetical protein
MEIEGQIHKWEYHPIYTGSICGFIYNDTKGRFVDGTWIITSTVKKVEDDIAYTRNSIYQLMDKANG